MPITREAVSLALAEIVHPGIGRPLAELGLIRDVSVTGDGNVAVTVMLGAPLSVHGAHITEAVKKAAARVGAKTVEVRLDQTVLGRDIAAGDPVPGAKNIVLVMSGKGGVGKSTVAANLTMALARAGARVGLLDADMYGPSIPTMFSVTERPKSADGKSIEPVERFGVKLMSIGLLLEDPTAAVVWRGPMLHGALTQFIEDVRWGELDYLVLDLPPGTGDVALTLSQRVRSTGAVIVTTPQEVALADVYKSVSMCSKVGIPILGIVENESYFLCDGCGRRHELFGSGGGDKIAKFAGAPLLAQIPIDPDIRACGDSGTPIVEGAPESGAAKAFVEAAARLCDRISEANVSRMGPLSIDRSGGTGPVHLPVVR
jgi:ATP-binding protein involved in chromosome partitioning